MDTKRGVMLLRTEKEIRQKIADFTEVYEEIPTLYNQGLLYALRWVLNEEE